MGQITFKEGGSITFKNGSITFLSNGPPMDAPSVTVQWIYVPGDQRYKARVTITNENPYSARLEYTVRVGTTVETYNEILGPWEDFDDICYVSERSPDNGFLFEVDAFLGDVNYVRPNSAIVSKQTAANFRRYLYNEGQNIASLRSGTTSGGYTFTENADHIYIESKAPPIEAFINVFPDPQSNDDISPLTDKKLFIDWSFISGDNDRDYLEIKYKTTTLKTYLSSFGRKEESFDIVDGGAFNNINIKLSDYTSPGGWPSASIYKIYIETINDGTPVW